MSTFDLESGISDPTNPKPQKKIVNKPTTSQPKAPSFDEESGIDPTQSMDYQTSHDSNVKNGDMTFSHSSKYEPGIMNAGQDQNEVRAANQGWGDKAANSLVKAAGLAGTGVIGTFTSLPYGLGGVVNNVHKKAVDGLPIDLQDFKPLIDNPIQSKLTEFNDHLEKVLPDYASQKEKDASAFSSDNILTPNFLFDKIIKNAGFTVGAIGSGKIVGSMLGSASKLLASGAYGAEKVAELETLMAKGIALPEALEKVSSALRVGEHFNQAIASGIAAAGEAQFEGADLKKTMKESLLQDFVEKNGRQPLPFEEADIEKRATAAGVVDLAVNLPILGLSDFIQFGNTLTKGFKVESSVFNKGIANRIEKGLGASLSEKVASKAGAFGLKSAFTEGAEEGSQTLTQKAAQDYYSRKKDLSAKDGIDDILKSTVYGASQLLGTKEGLESILLGAITGVGSHIAINAISGQLKQDLGEVNREYSEEEEGSTANLLKRMKEHSVENGLFAKYEGAVRGQSIQESLNAAVESGNVFEFQNLKHDRLKNMVQTYTQAGRLPQFLKQLDTIKDFTPTQFTEAFGVDTLETKSVAQYVQNLKNQVTKLSDTWNNVQTRFPLATADQKEMLWSSLADADNRLVREKQLDNKITGLLNNGVTEPTKLFSFNALLLKNKEDIAATRKEYREAAEKYIKDNSASQFDIEDVDELFKLQDDRQRLVEDYRKMKNGEFSTDSSINSKEDSKETSKEQSPNEESTTQSTSQTSSNSKPENTGTTENSAKQSTNSSSISPGTTSVDNTPSTSSNNELVNSMLLVAAKHKKGNIRALNEQEKLLFARYYKPKGKEDTEAAEKATDLLAEHLNNGTLDDFLKNANTPKESTTPAQTSDTTQSSTSPTTPTDDKSKREAFLKKDSVVLADLINYQKALKNPKSTEDFKNLVTQYPTFALKVTELEEEARELGLTVDRVKDLQAQILDLLPKAKTQGSTPEDAEVKRAKDEKDLTPLRIVVDGAKKGDKQVLADNEEARELYSLLQESVGTMPNGMSTTMSAKVVYDEDGNGKGKPTYNVFIDTDTQDGVLIGYLQNTTKDRELFNDAYLKTQDSLRKLAKENGEVEFNIQWNFGLNNNTTDTPQVLSKSVFKREDILGIYKLTKTNLDKEIRATNLLDEASRNSIGSRSIAKRLAAKGIRDGYVLQVKSPDGNERFIGMSGMPVEDFGKLREILDINNEVNGEKDPSLQLQNLEKNYWIAAARDKGQSPGGEPYSLVWQLARDGHPFIQVSRNAVAGVTQGDASNEEAISLYVNSENIYSQDQFLDSISVFENDKEAFEKRFPGLKPKDLFAKNPLRQEIDTTQGEPSLDQFNLSLNGQKPWNVGAIISSIPEEVSTPTQSQEKISTPITPDINDTVEDTIQEKSQPDKSAAPKREKGKLTRGGEKLGTKKVKPTFKTVEEREKFDRDVVEIEKKLRKFLPKSLKVRDLATLLNGFYQDGRTAGAYLDNIAYIDKNAPIGTEYHEAFHFVFRTLLNEKEQMYLRNILDHEGLLDGSQESIDKFRDSRSEYRLLTNAEATSLMQEEALADLFMSYMNNRDARSFTHRIFDKVKELFDKLLSFIGFVKGHQDTLEDAFNQIATGRFKSRAAQDAGSDVVFKSLPSLSSADSIKLVGMVRQNLLSRYTPGTNPIDLIDELIDEIADDKDAGFSKEYVPNLHSAKWLTDNEYQLDEETNRIYPLIFSPEGKNNILEEVEANMKQYGLFLNDEDNGLMTKKVDDADKRVKDLEYDTNTFSMTGFDNLSGEVKMFLTQLGTQSTDGLLIPISVVGTFSQLQRVLAGTTGYYDMLAKIRDYAESNTEMGVLYEKLTQKGTDEYFQEAFRNAFTLEYADHLHLSVEEKGSTHKLYASNRQDTGQLQLEKFKRNFEALLAKGVDIPQRASKIIDSLDSVEEAIEKGKQPQLHSLLAALKGVGIDIKEHTIQSILDGKEDINGEPYELEQFSEDLRKIELGMSIKNGNPYKVTDKEMEDDSSETADAITRVKRLGAIDALHRNDIYLTSFKNSEGETVFSFTKPNFELVRGREIENGIGLDDPFLKDNYFVKKFAGKKGLPLKVSVFGGLREENKDKGVTVKKIDPKSKLISDHMLYSEGYIDWAVRESKSTLLVVNIGSNTGKFTENNGNLSKSTLQAWKDFIKQDVDRIKRTIGELQTLDKRHWIEGYHFQGKESRGYDPVTKLPIGPDLTNPTTYPNGLKMIQFPQLQMRVENAMHNKGLSLSEALDDVFGDKSTIDEFLQDQHLQMVNSYINTLKNEGIDYTKQFKLLAGKSADSYNGVGEEKALKYIKDYVAGTYTLNNAYYQLMKGEKAYYSTDVEDTKRGGGIIAAGNSLGEDEYKAAMIADSMSQFNSETGEQKYLDYFQKAEKGFDKVNKSDAQSYMTPRRWQFAMKKLGKLNSELDGIITKIINNTLDTTSKQGIKDMRKVMEFATANPIKNVYFDGKVYVKTSIIPLFPQLTSEWDETNQKWIAKPEFAGLHNLRTQMEANGIDEVYRESAMKLQRWNKHFEDENGNFSFNENSSFNLQNKYWRLQVENPSGKMKITLGTQLLQLIDSEMNDEDDVEFNGGDVKIRDLRKIYQGLLSKATIDSNTRAQALYKKVGSDSKKRTLLFSILKNSAETSGSSESALEYYDQNKQGKLKFGTNLSHMSEVMEQGILSYFNKNVFGKKVPGMKLTLVSSAGVKVKDKETELMRDLAIHKVVNNQGKEEISYAECYLSEEILHKYDMTLAQFEAQDEATKEKFLNMLGFRIPTQSHHSMIPFKVVGFVPAIYGSVVFAPSEVTWLAGSDFDVDSLFVNRKEGYLDEKGKLHIYGESQDQEVQYKEWKKFIEKKDAAFELTLALLNEDADYKKFDKKSKERKEAKELLKKEVYKQLSYPASLEEWRSAPQESMYSINNGVLDTMLSFMRNAKNKESIFTPASMDSMKEMAEEIGSLLGESENSTLPYNFPGSLFSHWKNNTTGKANVGPAANASKTSAFLTKLGVQLTRFNKETSKVEAQSFRVGDAISTGYASNYEIGTGLRKADQLSTTVSAMTDNAKERLAAKLNLTVDNLATFGNMLALGFGMQRTMRFANQPILRKLSQRVTAAKSHLLTQGSNWEISQKFLNDMEKLIGKSNEELVDLRTTEFTDADLLSAINPANMQLINDIADGVKKASTLTDEEKKVLAHQYQVLNKYVQLENMTTYFRAVNSLLNTNKGPKPEYAAYDTLQEKMVLLASDKAPFDVLSAMQEKGKSIESNLDIALNEILPKGNQLFTHRTERFLKMKEKLSNYGRMNADKSKSLKRGYVAQLSVKLLENLLRPYYNGKRFPDLMSLLTGDKSERGDKANIVTKYNDIRAKYPELADNLFLNQVTPKEPNSKNPFFRLEYNSNMRTDPEFREQLTSSLTDLSTFGEEGHPVRKFYNDLYIYLALKDSLMYKNNSFISLFEPSRFAGLAKQLNQVQTIMKDIHTFGSQDENKEFKDLVGQFPAKFESDFLAKWVKEIPNRNGWKRINLDTASLKKMVYEVKKGTTDLDLSHLRIDSKLGMDNFAKLFEVEKEGNIHNGEFADFPLVLQTKKAPRDPTDEESDYSYNTNVQLWVRESLKDGVATYQKVDMSNYNNKLVPFAFPLDYQVPKPIKRLGNDAAIDDEDENGRDDAYDDETDNPIDEDAFDEEDEKDLPLVGGNPKKVEESPEEEPDDEDSFSEDDEADLPLLGVVKQAATKAVEDASGKEKLC